MSQEYENLNKQPEGEEQSHSPFGKSGQELPIVALRDLVVFPSATVPLLIGRRLSLGALEIAPQYDQNVILVTHKEIDDDAVTMESIYHTGVVGRIIESIEVEKGNYKVLVDCYGRVQLNSTREIQYETERGIFNLVLGDFTALKDEEVLSPNLERVYLNVIQKLFADMGDLVKVPSDIAKIVAEEHSLTKVMIAVLANSKIDLESQQEILEEPTLKGAAKLLIKRLTEELDILETQKRIQMLVQNQVSKNQREYYLNEQMKAIHKELDNLNNNGLSELDALEEQIKEAKMPKEAEEKALHEVKRLKSMPPMSSEGTVSRTYIDWLLKMPWNKRSRLRYGLKRAEKVLNEDHSGLEKIKDHILEYLAVINHTRTKKGKILCFIGPPGVGKTSLARSIAKATGREFVRMSLGGVHDESEIRGHRRTYIGAMPGKLVQLLTKAQRKNPLILLDELDKTGADHRGDPADALLEVLDPEQNETFMDHYLDVDVDLSEVMFIATANSYNIPAPLRDRMDIIELSSYTELEKLTIAKEHLVPEQLEEHKLTAKELQFPDEVLLLLIQSYTKEAGVRNLNRTIGALCRKFIKERLLAESDKERVKSLTLSREKVIEYLGAPKFKHGLKEREAAVGFVNGLAWTQVGGDLLGIEVELMPGKGELIATGSLGDVMKESVRTALTVIRARSNQFGLPYDFHTKWDIHVHAPEGAIPKDGPSAGSAITLAILSALLDIPIRSDIAMTGEVTLRGRVLEIGGVKEKLIAAHRAGIKTVLIPKENIKNLEDVPSSVLEELEVIGIEGVDEVFDYALTKPISKVEDAESFSGFYPLPNMSSGEKNNGKTL